MPENTMTKEQWVEVLDAAGVDQDGRTRWHQELERRYPEGHQAFLLWLQLPEDEISMIREKSRE